VRRIYRTQILRGGVMEVIDLGRKNYLETWQLQKELLEKRIRGGIEDTLLFVEHHPVYTVGRGETATKTEIKVHKLGTVPVVEVERGGKITFHGSGQIVGYPIFSLPHQDLRQYLKDLERTLVSTISEQTLLNAKPCPETLLLEPGQLQTGVWIRDKKVASIGIAIKHWVTYHGFALNVSTDLNYFEAIEPCGFSGQVITTLTKELGNNTNPLSLTTNLKRTLAAKFEALSVAYTSQAKNKTFPLSQLNAI